MRLFFLMVVLVHAVAKIAPAQDSVPRELTDEAVKIVRAHLDAIGGPDRLGAVRNLTIKGSLTIPEANLQGTVTSVSTINNQSLATVELNGVGTLRSGFVDQRAWEISPIDGAKIKNGGQTALAAFDSRPFPLINYQSVFNRLKVIPTEEFLGRASSVLEGQLTDGQAIKLYFDPESHFHIGTRVTLELELLGETELTYSFEDYRATGGILISHKQTVITPFMRQNTEIDEVNVNKELDPKMFEAPEEIKALLKKQTNEPNQTKKTEPAEDQQFTYYEFVGTLNDRERSSSFRLILDSKGSFHHSASRDQTRYGSDGSILWKQDKKGITATLSHSDRERSLMFVQLMAGSLLQAPLVELESRPTKSNSDLPFRIVHSPGQWQIQLNRDQYPVDVRFETASGRHHWAVKDFTLLAGQPVPKNIEISGPDEQFTVSIESCQLVTDMDRAIFSRPDSRPMDTEFLAELAPQLTVKRAAVGSVMCQIELDGGEAVWFVFDTGAGGNLIDKSLANRLGMPSNRKSMVSWVGENVEASVVTGKSLRAGPVLIHNPDFHAVDLTQLRQMIDPRVAGVIGYELLSRCVCEIDLATDRISLLNPDTGTSDRRAWSLLTFHENLPLVTGKFPGGDGYFRIDVGAAGGPAANVIFHSTAAKEFGLTDQPGAREISTMNIRLLLGTMPWFEISGFRHPPSAALFSLAERGALADPYVTGNLGVEFLRPFQVVLDYQQSRVAITLNK